MSVGNPKLTLVLTNDIGIINNLSIIAKNNGTTTLKVYNNNNLVTQSELNFTNIIVKPPLEFDLNKPYLSCNKLTEEQARLADEILNFRIYNVGYQTRAATVEAARFLALEFPYRISYFFENGRIHPSEVHYVDDKGRYYHKGMYLHEYKLSDIIATYSGPAIWGCPLTNLDNSDPNFVLGKKYPNGLDYSGFVSWVLYNAGFDVGDIGAGETAYKYQLIDIGIFTKLTNEIINSNTVKVGDLLNTFGHIAIIVGIDDDYYYVAEYPRWCNHQKICKIKCF